MRITSPPEPRSITIVLTGICVHFAQSSNPELPVPYRIVLPASTSLNRFGHVELGNLRPTVVINGAPVQSGPLVIDITGQPSGAPLLPPEQNAPHLTKLAHGIVNFNTDLAYANLPTAGIFINLSIPGDFSIDPTTKNLQFVASEVTDLQVTVGGGILKPLLATNTIAIANEAWDGSSLTPNADETLLGFLAVASSVPSTSTPPPVPSTVPSRGRPITMEWVDPSQPGCSNSQWP
ncbi:MAG TPA: hypothetical protein VGF48_00820 [Thermoanaerobaculia bacterium]|jgi:hypothetical protein